MQSLRMQQARAVRSIVLPQRRLLAVPPSRIPTGIPPVAPAPSGAVPVRPVVVASTPIITPGSSTIADQNLSSSEIPPPPPPPNPTPKRPRRLFRRFLLYTTLGTLIFYPLSGFVSTKSEPYREFFTSTFPLGEEVADFAEEQLGARTSTNKTIQGLEKGQRAGIGAKRVDFETRGSELGDGPGAQFRRDAEAKAAAAKKEVGRGVDKVENAAEKAKAEAKDAAARAKAGVLSAADKTKAEAKDLADKTKAGARDVADKTKAGARDAAARTESAAKEAAAKAEEVGRDAKATAQSAADKVKAGAKDIAGRTEALAHDAKVQAERAASRASAEAANLKDRVVHATQDAADKAATLARDAKNRVVDATSSIPFNASEGIEGIVRETEGALNRGGKNVADAVHRGEANVKDALHRGEANVKNAVQRGEDAVDGAVRKAEKNVADASATPTSSRIYPDTQRPRELRPETVTPAKPTFEGQTKYAGPALPLGFEPPPGQYIPPPPKPAAGAAAPTLPLLAPKVKDFGTDEPIISQLASTIDSLTSSLSAPGSGPSANATGILSKAQDDLTALSKRLGDIKKAEKEKLQRSLEAKKQEFEATLQKAEAGRQRSEAGLSEKWEKERAGMVADWKKDMDSELESQREGIEKRLREEVVQQGIELQRRWLRSIKTQVETERGGRLAKLDDLTTSLHELKTITLDNSATLDQNVRVHKVWSALRAVQAKSDAGDVSFENELRVLRSLNTSDSTQSATVAAAALEQLEASGIASTGVKSLAALSSWFTTSVSPRVQSAALVPAPEDAGVASHLASLTLSKIMFRPTPGPVDGADVSAVLARAEWCLAEKDLDGAAREVNRLQGWPKRLASDWLREARRALEVKQALEVVATDATLGSLLLV